MKKTNGLFWRILWFTGVWFFVNSLVNTVRYVYAVKTNGMNTIIEKQFTVSPYFFGAGVLLVTLSLLREYQVNKKITASE